ASTNCPPVLLVSAGPPMFETRTGVLGSGPLNKAQSPADLLEILEGVLEVPRASRSEEPEPQKAPLNRQQGWADSIPTCRFWGINE
ncbi:MAG TPA: hypothetical protein VHI52_13285, partial [Verrucomicrobiae bacterium]|nr:hypothetical protein [Verrucomicrobiae bacterium]